MPVLHNQMFFPGLIPSTAPTPLCIIALRESFIKSCGGDNEAPSASEWARARIIISEQLSRRLRAMLRRNALAISARPLWLSSFFMQEININGGRFLIIKPLCSAPFFTPRSNRKYLYQQALLPLFPIT